MARTVHEFTITRKIQGEDTEIELKASFEIEEEVERAIAAGRTADGCTSARLVGEIFLVDDGIPWSGRLNRRERARAEAAAYDAWAEENEVDRHQSLRDDSCLVDRSFDDFDDDMALKVAGRGTVTW